MRSRVLFVLLTIAFVPQAFAKPPQLKVGSPALRNVELSAASEFRGQLLDDKGIKVANSPIVVQCGKFMARTTTNATGHFRLKLDAGGLCQIHAADGIHVCRVWKHGTAPPKSISQIALVQNEASIVRGNMFRRRSNCPSNCECQDCRQHRSGKLKGAVALLGLGGVAAYMAFSRDNASD